MMRLLLAAALLLASVQVHADPKAEVQAALEEYIRLTNTHDFDRVAPMLDPAAVYWFRDRDSRGIEQVRAAFDHTWSIVKDEFYSVHDVQWLAVDDEAAAVIYEYRWRGLIGGVERSGGGRGTNVFRKTGAGWRITHEHLSPYVEAAK